MSFTLKINGDSHIFEKPIKLKDLNNDKKFIACLVNGRIRELDYDIHYDAEVKFLTTKDSQAVPIYERGIRFILAMAQQTIYPDIKFKFSYNISRGIYVQMAVGDMQITQTVVDNLSKEMQRIIDADYKFERKIITNSEAEELYKSKKLFDKLEMLKYRPEKTVHIYQCDWYFNYMFGKMVPSTGYLKDFKLIYYPPGMLIQYPRSEFKGEIPPFKDEPIFSLTLQGSNSWSELVQLSDVGHINDANQIKDSNTLINICENRHNRMLVELGDKIESNINEIRLICIAGPSSSGKTTFADRLTHELLSRGIHPIRISIDDYYKRREDVPKDDDGNYDFESLNALDVDLFNKQLLSLLSGEEVFLPSFDFKTNDRIFNRKVKVNKEDPIIIEGIHALNEDLTPYIPKNIKYKVYISPQAQINLDFENPISLTDIRLIRRIVRDFKYRNSSAEITISMWPSVRRGEFQWIYKTQEDADFVFDSFLNYELGVMKKYALPLLKKVDVDGPYGNDAQRLIKLLKYFTDVNEKYIPCTSLLREFIGGSCYREVE